MRRMLAVAAVELGLLACGGGGGDSPSADVTPPSTPAGLAAKVVHPTEVRLSWSASIDSGVGVAGYNVYRDGVRIASTAETSYRDDNVEPGRRYLYSVSSYDQAVPVNESAQVSPLKVAMTYVIKDLCAVSGFRGLSAVDLTNSGIVLALGAGENHRWIIYRDGALTNFLDASYPLAMNESGDVIAVDSQLDGSNPGGIVRKGILYRAGTFTDLGTLGGRETWPRDLNNSGKVVGYSTDSDAHRHAFLWQDGLLTDIGLTDAYSINDAGEIAGSVWPMGSDFQAIVRLTNEVQTIVGQCWSPDVPRDESNVRFMKINAAGQILCRAEGTFDAAPGGDLGRQTVSSASFVDGGIEFFDLPRDDMNDAGQLVGDGVVYRQGVKTAIPQLPGCPFVGRFLRINNPGQIVGTVDGSVGDVRCEKAILVANGKTWDLNDLVDETDPLHGSLDLQSGSFINDSGDLVAAGRDTSGEYCGAYLLTLRGVDATP